MRFEFAAPNRIIFGPGTFKELGPLAAGFGHSVLLVTGAARPPSDLVTAQLSGQGLPVSIFPVAGEPTTHVVGEGVRQARAAGCDLVIGFGGGSAVDASKAIAILLANGGEPLDYLEVIGRGQPFLKPAAPCIAIPTTAGAGAEVTRNAVLASPEHRVKVSLRSPYLLPRVALVDPALTYSLPPAITASTGLDAVTQLIEPYVSVRANPLAGALCREGLVRAARSLRRAYEQGDDAAAREDMSLASLFGGLALANAGLGAAHGMASVLGGSFAAPHGAVCACLLPHVMQTNVRALQERAPDNPALRRYAELGEILTGRTGAGAGDAVGWTQDLCRVLRVPGLSAYGMTRSDIPEVVEKSLVASSTQANPIKLTGEELSAVLEASLDGYV
jgi:alcohol dehydrogenase class IV